MSEFLIHKLGHPILIFHKFIFFLQCVGWLEERHKDCLDKYLELICKPIELAKGLCYVSKVLELHCTWPGQVKSAVKEGVGRFIKNSKQRIIDYTKDTFLYKLFNKTVRKGIFV